MKPRTFWLAAALVGGILACFAVTHGFSDLANWISGSPLQGDPVIDYPSRLDLGEHEVGDEIVARYTIGNRGTGELLVDQIRTNCSCSGMELEQGGRFYAWRVCG